jgi:aryl-phospho-beta-D-glucosidase BglC (GH1 family)
LDFWNKVFIFGTIFTNPKNISFRNILYLITKNNNIMDAMNSRKIIFFVLFVLIGLCFSSKAQPGVPVSDLSTFCSQQKGFNLLGYFDVNWSNKGFSEKDFIVMEDLGFNFVRLPLDYRTYTLPGNWDNFTEIKLAKIDQVIEWGEKYNIHICINLHRAPGYCVNQTNNLPANQQLDLWTDIVAQNAFVNHWHMFSDRYKNISAERLSFNLVNEPNDVEEEVYVPIMKKAIKAIHNITPGRVVFVDGLGFGRGLLLSLKDEPNIAQAIHSYDPFQLTHYKASWVNGSSDWPVPKWPMLSISNYLYGTWKSEFKSPLVILGDFETGTEIIVNVRQVSIESTLSIKAGTKTLLSKRFVCGPEKGEDFTQIVKTEWGYQNISNKDFSVILTENATKISFENAAGDWMTLNSITIKNGERIHTFELSDNSWGKKQDTYKLSENGELKTVDGSDLLPFENYRKIVEVAKLHNIPIMVQEFGVHNQTPHQVAVDFLSDLSAFFRENNLGWALWNLTGSFGIMNSDRKDCTYEYYQGYQLDRDMLDALTKSGTTGTSEISKQNTFKLYPVPAKDVLYLNSKNLAGITKIEIWDIAGRNIKTFNVEVEENKATRLDIRGMKSGMYLLTASAKTSSFTGKFLVK